MKKKTLYEILDVPQGAAAPDITAAYEKKLAALQALQAHMNAEDHEFETKLLAHAREVLLDPVARGNYDTWLAAQSAPAPLPGTETAVVVRQDTEAVARQAEALALRAEAMALRADALALRNGLGYSEEPPTLRERLLSMVSGSARKVIMALGIVAALGMIMNVFFLSSSVRRAEQVQRQVEAASGRVDEKAIIEKHFQKYGVRPASAAEARRLEAEYRRTEQAERDAERERKRTEDAQRRFEEESRQEAERISADLARAEEAAKREAEYRRVQQEEEERRRQVAEQMRIEGEMERLRAKARGGY